MAKVVWVILAALLKSIGFAERKVLLEERYIYFKNGKVKVRKLTHRMSEWLKGLIETERRSH